MMHPLAGRKQSPEHVAKRTAAVLAERTTWSDEKRALWKRRISANSAASRPEVREANAAAHRGRKPWNKGIPCSEEQKHILKSFMKGHVPWNKGCILGQQKPGWIQKRTEARRGYRHNEETKKRIRETNRITWEKPEVRIKVTGSNSPSWRGGISFEPYSVDWTDELRSAIRRRDGYQCQLCGRKDKPIDVHHVDYDKGNLDPRNLISLCRSCHSKTNYRRRYWKEFLGGKL